MKKTLIRIFTGIFLIGHNLDRNALTQFDLVCRVFDLDTFKRRAAIRTVRHRIGKYRIAIVTSV